MARRRGLLYLAAATLLTVGGAADARPPLLRIADGAQAAPLPPGVSRLGDGAIAYRPPSAGAGPRPLLVLFHGAGMSAGQMIDAVIPQAARCACLLLAVKSAGATWDLVTASARVRRSGDRTTPGALFGDDAARVERPLAAALASPLVDRRRVLFIGFSDGASYALSLGLANPAVVRGVVAIAPGFHLEPAAIDPGQRLFVAHSPEDRVLSFANSRDRIVASLQRAGFAAVFHSFPGGHVIDRGVVGEGIAHTLGPAQAGE